VADSRNARDGAVTAQIGTYDPSKKDAKDAIKIDNALALEWLGKGALPTETTRVILEKAGVLAKEKKAKTSTPKAKPAKAEKKPK